ncbi:MAG: Do family serine endopeptidase [Alphaproteobacteria bacterium]|nr:Do family serine endopeptidase [Alphaproteobacteria bacterium]
MKSRALLQPNTYSNGIRANGMRALFLLMLGITLVLAQTVATYAKSVPESLADLVDKVSPAVVNITTTTMIAASTGQQNTLPDGAPFDDLFRDFMDRQQQQGGPRRASALGSGFIISETGYIVTNNHVIDGADEIQIELFNGGTLKATIVGTDVKTDLALLKVESDEPLPFVSFGDSDIARVGDWVMAVGNPLGQGFSVSAGIISARNRALRGTYDDFIQTDAAINRGNSGGPLFNMDGEVIGVNTAILSPNGGGSIGIGFSMSSAVVSRVMDQLREFGETRRGWLGVRIQDVSQDLAESLSLSDVAGALVTDVPDGPAKIAGIQQGDVIVTFDGKHVPDTRELVRMVGDTAVGKTVRVVVFRDGKTQTLKVVLTRREDAEKASIVPAATQPEVTQEKELLGLKLKGLDADLRGQLGLNEGDDGVIVMGVDEASQAFEKGLRAGDLIVEAGQQKVASLADLSKRIEQAREAGRKSILLLITRGGDRRFVALSLGS